MAQKGSHATDTSQGRLPQDSLLPQPPTRLARR